MPSSSDAAALRQIIGSGSAELVKILLSWETKLGRKVRTVRTDCGTEYNEFGDWCHKNGVSRERSVPYVHQQNGRAERFNRTLSEKVRAMLLESGIAKKYWAEALATRLYNVSPTLLCVLC